MNLINFIYADDGLNISDITAPGVKIKPNFTLSDLLTGKSGGLNLLNFIFIVVGLVFFANLVMSGWEYLLSSGDPKKIAAATTRLLNSFVGLIMAIAAFLVVRLITSVLNGGTPLI